MTEVVQMIRMIKAGRTYPASFMTKKMDDGIEYTCKSGLSNEENEKIFNELDRICRPKNFEPGLFILLCEVEFERTATVKYKNAVVTKFISLQEVL